MSFLKNMFKTNTCSDIVKTKSKELAEVADFMEKVEHDPSNILCNESVKSLFQELQQYYVNIQSTEWKDEPCNEVFNDLMKKYAECKERYYSVRKWQHYSDSCEVKANYISPENAQTGGGGKKKTKKSVMVGKVKRVIYEGPRGGQYIKQNGGYVALRTVSKK